MSWCVLDETVVASFEAELSLWQAVVLYKSSAQFCGHMATFLQTDSLNFRKQM